MVSALLALARGFRARAAGPFRRLAIEYKREEKMPRYRAQLCVSWHWAIENAIRGRRVCHVGVAEFKASVFANWFSWSLNLKIVSTTSRKGL